MSDPSPTSVHAFRFGEELVESFGHSVSICTSLSMTRLLNEESLTGALLGSIASSFPLISLDSAAQGDDLDAEAECFWLPFNTGGPQNPWSEARNGADFAILLIDRNGLGRFAAFQAKRSAVSCKDGRWYIDVRHIPESQKLAGLTQMVALVGMAERLLLANGSSPSSNPTHDRIGHLTWIHYLAYGNGTPSCAALGSMSHAFAKETPPIGDDNQVEFFPNEGPTLFNVFGEFGDPDSAHWLTLKTPAALSELLFWIEILPVVIVADRESWKHVPGSLRSKRGVEAAASAMQRAGRGPGSRRG